MKRFVLAVLFVVVPTLSFAADYGYRILEVKGRGPHIMVTAEAWQKGNEAVKKEIRTVVPAPMLEEAKTDAEKVKVIEDRVSEAVERAFNPPPAPKKTEPAIPKGVQDLVGKSMDAKKVK